jgi:hypothetical protein
MTLWLHMFSWVVLHVPIKSYDLVLSKASPTLNRVVPRIMDKSLGKSLKRVFLSI